MSAILLPVLIGLVSLVAEFGDGLVVKTENQRAADLATYAASLAYASTNSTAVMTSVAKNVAALNGVSPAAVTASLVASPRVATNKAVLVNVATSNVLFLAPVLGYGRSLPVSADAYGQLGATASACILALSGGGAGVALSGGTTISASSCTLASNASITVPCGTKVTAKAISYNGAAPTQGCAGGITGTTSKAATADPLASDASVLALTAHETAVDALASPAAPSVTTAPDNSFQYSASATLPTGCTGTFSNGTWTLSCAASGTTYRFGALTVGGGVTVNVTTSASATYTFSGPINNGGSALTFGAGTFKMAKGIISGGGSTTTFGAGTFTIGPGSATCSSYAYSVCSKGTSMTFAGPSTFSVSAGIYNAGGSKLTLGSGTTNSFVVGNAGDGYAVNLAGGGTATFADATGTGSLFQLNGDFYQSGGACTTLSAAAQHDINGNFNTAGGVLLGAGTYTTSGYIAFGAQSGGDVSCNGSNIGVSGTGVTLVTQGLQTLSGGNCSGMAFCIGSGFSNVTLVSPSSGTNINLAVIGPTSSGRTGGASFTAGASNTAFAGAVYFPYGPVTLSGGASIGNIAGQCLELVGSNISLTGGTTATTASCTTSSSSSSSSVALVQ